MTLCGGKALPSVEVGRPAPGGGLTGSDGVNRRFHCKVKSMDTDEVKMVLEPSKARGEAVAGPQLLPGGGDRDIVPGLGQS